MSAVTLTRMEIVFLLCGLATFGPFAFDVMVHDEVDRERLTLHTVFCWAMVALAVVIGTETGLITFD